MATMTASSSSLGTSNKTSDCEILDMNALMGRKLFRMLKVMLQLVALPSNGFNGVPSLSLADEIRCRIFAIGFLTE